MKKLLCALGLLLSITQSHASHLEINTSGLSFECAPLYFDHDHITENLLFQTNNQRIACTFNQTANPNTAPKTTIRIGNINTGYQTIQLHTAPDGIASNEDILSYTGTPITINENNPSKTHPLYTNCRVISTQ